MIPIPIPIVATFFKFIINFCCGLIASLILSVCYTHTHASYSVHDHHKEERRRQEEVGASEVIQSLFILLIYFCH